MLALDVSPLAAFLVGLAERRASGTVTLIERSMSLVNGEVTDVSAAAGDSSYADFLVQSERLSAQSLAALQTETRAGVAFAAALVQSGKLTAHEHRKLLRALWLDRFVRELQRAQARPKLVATLDATESSPPPSAPPWALLPFVLDAWSRLAVLGDAAAVGMRIDHRLLWVEAPLAAQARRWASFGDLQERPVVASVLGRLPAATCEIAALVRLGFARLLPPGGETARPRSTKTTLPPPAPRLSSLAAAPSDPPASIVKLELDEAPPQREQRVRPPRHRMQPGDASWEIEALPVVELARWPKLRGPLEDPLRVLELEIALLEQQDANGKARALAFVRLAALWQSRIGSLEHATRALREAAAADPEDSQILLQAARQCAALGQTDLALAYARAVAFSAELPRERAAGQRALADLYAALGEPSRELEALSEAAAENPEDPEPHERLAQSHFERGDRQLAATHARRAALGRGRVTGERELGWAAIAYAWDPAEPASATGYRDALASRGLFEAAIAVGREGALVARSPEIRARLQLEAAELARRSERFELAAELLLERFDADLAGSAPLYRALDQAWAGAGPSYEHAAVVESIARAAAPEHKAVWFDRCAELLDKLPGESEAATHARAVARQARDAGGRQRGDREPGPDEPARERAELMARIRLVSEHGSEHEAELLARACAQQLQAGDLRQAVSCGMRALAIEPHDRATAARLWRATALHGDAVLQREALISLARAQSGSVVARARTLALLARQLEALGEYDAAVEAADTALASQPMAADAALIVLRHAHRLPPPRAAALLQHGRSLLGTCPPLLMSLAQAVIASGQREQALEVLEHCIERLPLWLEAQHLVLDLWMEQTQADPLASAALRLLSHSQDPVTLARLEQTVLRLIELSAPEPAARLALQSLDARCRVDLAYAQAAAELARRADDRDLLTRALERVVSCSPATAAPVPAPRANEPRAHPPGSPVAAEPGPQVQRLVEIAEHHARGDDRVGEVRAWLRVLSLTSSHGAALESLSRLFAESGDCPRLLVVLSLALEASRTPRERRDRWLALASAALRVGHDREKAAQYVGALVVEAAKDLATLRHAIGALFALGDGGWATRKARELVEPLPPEAAGAVFVWLAQRAEVVACDPALALELAVEGARRFPQVGELLLIAERLSLDARDRETALALYRDLIGAAAGDHGKRALVYRAGRWLERHGSFEEALAHYTQAFELARTTGVAYQALARVARNCQRLTPLVDAQETLADLATDNQARLQLLREAARTSGHELNDPERGFRNLLKADELARVGELDLQMNELVTQLGARDEGARERALRELAGARELRALQLWEAPEKAKLLLNAARLHLRERGDARASLTTLAPLFHAELQSELSPELQADSLFAIAEAQLGSGEEAQALQMVERWLRVTPDDPRAQALHGRLSARPPPPEPEPEAERATAPEPLPQPLLRPVPLAESEPEPFLPPVVFSAPMPTREPELPQIVFTQPLLPPEPELPSIVFTEPSPAPQLFLPPVVDPEPEPAPKPEPPPRAASLQPQSSSSPANDATTARPPAPPALAELSLAEPALAEQAAITARPRAEGPTPDWPASHEAATTRPPVPESIAPEEEPAEEEHAPAERAPETPPPPPRMERVSLAPPELLEHLQRGDALDLSALRKLFGRAQTAQLGPEASVAGQILSLFDPAVAPPTASFGVEQMLAAQAFRFVHPNARRELRELMALLWSAASALPQLQRSPEDFGVKSAQEVANENDSLHARFAELLSLLGAAEIGLLTTRKPATPLSLLPTSPPCIVAQSGLKPTPVHVFEMARFLVYAEPAHAVVCVLPEVDGRDLLAAMVGAFGWRGDARESTSPSRDLASQQLWHALPPRVRGQLRELVRSQHTALDYASLRHEAQLCAARAGLLAMRDVRSAIESLAQLESLDVHSALGFQLAYDRSPSLKELIRAAFSETYLELTELPPRDEERSA